MSEVDVYLASALAVLFGFLYWSLSRRLRVELARQRALEKENPGRGFEGAAITPQIQRVRQNFVGAVQGQRHFPCGRRARIAAARGVVSRLSFFRRVHDIGQVSADGHNEFQKF